MSPSRVATLTATVDDDNGLTSLTATVDLTNIGGSATQTLFDDATNGDVTAGDGIFTYNNVQVVGDLATQTGVVLTVSVTDGVNVAVTDTITVDILNADPVIANVEFQDTTDATITNALSKLLQNL